MQSDKDVTDDHFLRLTSDWHSGTHTNTHTHNVQNLKKKPAPRLPINPPRDDPRQYARARAPKI